MMPCMSYFLHHMFEIRHLQVCEVLKCMSNHLNMIMFESVSGDEMMRLFTQQHHETGVNPEMEQFVRDHSWGIRMIPAHEIPDYDHDVYYHDPFKRIIDWDENRIRYWRSQMRSGAHVPPIILGPHHAIIDGNHRAQAAKSMNQPIQAYVPMKHDKFVVESMLNQFRRWAGIP